MISFKVVNVTVNRVVFVEEKNITMQCSVIGAVDVTILALKIYDLRQRIVAQNLSGGNRLEYVIGEIYSSDAQDGLYTCEAQFSAIYSRKKTKTIWAKNATMHLKVRKGGPHCFRNGTEGTPYQSGDKLSMLCYCKTTEPCGWIKMTEGKCFSLSQNTKIFTYRNKTIHQILEKYSSRDPNSISYVCRNAITSKAVSQSCIVGPQSKSSCDVIIADNEDDIIPNTYLKGDSYQSSGDFFCDVEMYGTNTRSISSGMKIFVITIISLFIVFVFVVFVVVTAFHLRESYTLQFALSDNSGSVQHTYDRDTYSTSLNTYELAN